MADNLLVTAGVATYTQGCDEITYSGDAAIKLPVMRILKITGAEGAKVVGSLNYHVVGAASTNAASILANPGEIHSIRAFSIAADPVFIKLHNTSSTPTAGAGVLMAFALASGIPYAQSFPGGIPFSTGIGITIVRGLTDASATALLNANEVVVDIEYTRTA